MILYVSFGRKEPRLKKWRCILVLHLSIHMSRIVSSCNVAIRRLAINFKSYSYTLQIKTPFYPRPRSSSKVDTKSYSVRKTRSQLMRCKTFDRFLMRFLKYSYGSPYSRFSPKSAVSNAWTLIRRSGRHALAPGSTLSIHSGRIDARLATRKVKSEKS